MLESDMPALGALLKPRSLDEFFDEYWPDKSTYFLADGDPARLPEFLRAEELHNIEAMARANKGGVWVSNAAKSGHMMKIDRRAAPYAYKMGLTVYLDDLTGGLPGATGFCRQIEADLGLPPNTVRATGWASPTESGATCHYDTDDIISVQLRGTKRFELAPMVGMAIPTGRQFSPGTRLVDETYPQMVNGFPSWQDATFESLEMAPGSALFFQRGTWHRTHSGGDSLSISFVLEPPTAAECILRLLRDVMLQDPRWRQPLYGAWGSGAQNQAAFREIEALLAQVPEIAGVIAPRDVARAFMTDEQRLASIDGESRFQRIPNATVSAGPPAADSVEVGIVHRQEDGSEERLATLTVPPLGLEVLNWIATQDAPFRVDALAERFPKIPFEGLGRLLESSAKAGLVKMLWFPALGDRRS
jgi:hypothetical protein